MKFDENKPARIFTLGKNDSIEISDCGEILLESNEQVTFVTESGKEHDFAAKSWGFYATPSVNGRLRDQGFKTALVKNSYGKYYIMVVEQEKMADFETYLENEENKTVQWLDEL